MNLFYFNADFKNFSKSVVPEVWGKNPFVLKHSVKLSITVLYFLMHLTEK